MNTTHDPEDDDCLCHDCIVWLQELADKMTELEKSKE